MIIKDKYKNLTLEKAEEYRSKGWIVVCDGDGWVVEIKKEK